MTESKATFKQPLPLRIIPWFFPKLEKIWPWLANKLFVYVFFKPLRYPMPAVEREALRDAHYFDLYLNRKHIQGYSWGQGPAVLVVHGWAGRATQFRKFIGPLNRAGYRVVGFDGPAHGYSQGTRTEIIEFRETIEAVIHHIGSVRAIIGHSFGGAAALYAISKGAPVRTAITISSPVVGDEIITTYLHVLNASQRVGDYFKAYVLNRTGKPFDAWTSREFIKHVPPELNLLLVHDTTDHEVGINQPQALKEAFPTAELVVTTGYGHHRILKADEVIQTIVRYLLDHEPPGDNR